LQERYFERLFEGVTGFVPGCKRLLAGFVDAVATAALAFFAAEHASNLNLEG
jgi:hypothetical protein